MVVISSVRGFAPPLDIAEMTSLTNGDIMINCKLIYWDKYCYNPDEKTL